LSGRLDAAGLEPRVELGPVEPVPTRWGAKRRDLPVRCPSADRLRVASDDLCGLGGGEVVGAACHAVNEQDQATVVNPQTIDFLVSGCLWVVWPTRPGWSL
jgi:hypothetical protein